MEVLEYPMLLPSNYLLVGGMNIVAKEADARNYNFTGELRKFIDSAEEGLFVLSFGNNRYRMYEPGFLQKVLDAFRMFQKYRCVEYKAFKLKYTNIYCRIIAKFTPEVVKNLTIPPNLFHQEYIPQQALMAHPKTKYLFKILFNA